MTWKEFKEEMEKLGLKDEDRIWYIDVHPMPGEPIVILEDQDLGKAVY